MCNKSHRNKNYNHSGMCALHYDLWLWALHNIYTPYIYFIADGWWKHLSLSWSQSKRTPRRAAHNAVCLVHTEKTAIALTTVKRETWNMRMNVDILPELWTVTSESNLTNWLSSKQTSRSIQPVSHHALHFILSTKKRESKRKVLNE